MRSNETAKNMPPFNLDTYEAMLGAARSQRRFVTYDEVLEQDSFILWRHDCDMSLNRALELAEIDARFGIVSTFFIHPRSEFYNIFEYSQTALLRKITQLGHRIGLHFDAEYHKQYSTGKPFVTALQQDASLVEAAVETKVSVFSFHNPDQGALAYDNFEYAGIINCYSKWLKENVVYKSDSNGYWRHEPIPLAIARNETQRLQILTHPEWWLSRESSPRDRVLRCVYGRAIKTMSDYDAAMGFQSDRENVGVRTGKILDDVTRAEGLLFGANEDGH